MIRPQGVAPAREGVGHRPWGCRPLGRGGWPPGRCSRPHGVLLPGRASGFRRGCGRCGKKHFSRMQTSFLHVMQKTFFPHFFRTFPARAGRVALETVIIAGAQACNAKPLLLQARLDNRRAALPRKQDQRASLEGRKLAARRSWIIARQGGAKLPWITDLLAAPAPPRPRPAHKPSPPLHRGAYRPALLDSRFCW